MTSLQKESIDNRTRDFGEIKEMRTDNVSKANTVSLNRDVSSELIDRPWKEPAAGLHQIHANGQGNSVDLIART
jgi:hypothetical protein